MRHKKLKKWFTRFLIFITLTIICIPGLWVVLSSFRPVVEILAKPAIWIPEDLSFKNYMQMFGIGYDANVAVPVSKYFINSVIISVTSTIIAIFFGMLGGYVFSRYNFRFKSHLFLWFMLSRAIPGISLSLPLFMVYSWTGLIDTKTGVILVYVAMNIPFTIWLTEGFFMQIPRELNEAGRVDGCTPVQAFLLIELPLARTGIASAGIFAFLVSWNEYALASVLTRSTNSKTLPVGIMDYTAQFTFDWTGMCTMAVIIILPAVILTFIIQKHLISGLTLGGVKG